MLSMNSNVLRFAKFLFYLKVILFVVAIYSMPIYDSMNGNSELQASGIIGICLIVLDIMMARLICMNYVVGVWGIGLTSCAAFALMIVNKKVFDIETIALNSYWLLIYAWDFIILIFLALKQNTKELSA